MKRILHIITTIEPGGAEKQLLVLSKAQSIKGDKVSVIYLKGEATLKNQFEQHDVEVITKGQKGELKAMFDCWSRLTR